MGMGVGGLPFPSLALLLQTRLPLGPRVPRGLSSDLSLPSALRHLAR